jgi:hypothetical protein
MQYSWGSVMPILSRKVTTILEPSTELTDELTLSTDRVFNTASYVIPCTKIRGTEGGSIIADLPVQSNIHILEKKLDDYHKKIPQSDILSSFNGGVHRKMYTDNFGRFTASKVERAQGTTFNLRGDVATHLTLQCNMFVQCDPSQCLIFTPKKMSVDLTRFTVKK